MPSLLFVRLHDAWEVFAGLAGQFPGIALRYSTVVGLAMLETKTPASIAFWTRIIAYSFYPEGAHSELLERSHPWLLDVLFCTCQLKEGVLLG